MTRVLVVGKGLAGVASALAARAAGAEVTVVGAGPGATAFCGGVAWPEADVGEVRVGGPLHATFAACPKGARYADGWGALRDGAFAQPAQAMGVLDPHRADRGVAVVGLRGAPQLIDAEGVAGALRSRGVKAQAREVDLSLTAVEARRSPFDWATALDSAGELDRFANGMQRVARGDDLLLLPPLVGWRPETFAQLGMRLKGRVAELVATQPSVPGLRLSRSLEAALERAGCRSIAGTVVSLVRESAEVASADRGTEIVAFDAAVLASGRYLGGGIRRQGVFREPVASLPLGLGSGKAIDSNEPIERLVGHSPGERAPAFELGVGVDWQLHPIGANGHPVPWLWAAGSIIAGADRGLAFALRTGAAAGEAAAGGSVTAADVGDAA